jgi:hypothetical protein
MKRIVFLLLFAITFPKVCVSQNTFEKMIDTLGVSYFSCVKQTYDGGFITCGGNSSISGGNLVVIKFDSVGTIDWARQYIGSGSDGGTYIEQTIDSGYMVSSVYDASSSNGKCWMLRLNQLGDTLWTKVAVAGTNGTFLSQQNSMASVNDSIYAMIGYVDIPSQWSAGFMIPVLKSGVLLSPKIYDYAYWGISLTGINKTSNFGYILTGAYALSSTMSEIYVLRTNAYGDTNWTKRIQIPVTINGVGQAVEETDDSGIIVCGYAMNTVYNKQNTVLVKTDSLGDTLWTKIYGGEIIRSSSSIKQTNDYGFIIVGSRIDGLTSNLVAYLLKTNVNGDSLWEKQFGYPSNSIGIYAQQTNDGGFIMSGQRNSVNGLVAYLVKTDSSGNVLTGLNSIELNNQYSYSIFPNPSSGIVNVRLGDIYQQNAQIEIFDASYRKVYSKKISNMSNQIDLSNVVNGLYMAVLSYNGNAVLRKFVIKK